VALSPKAPPCKPGFKPFCRCESVAAGPNAACPSVNRVGRHRKTCSQRPRWPRDLLERPGGKRLSPPSRSSRCYRSQGIWPTSASLPGRGQPTADSRSRNRLESVLDQMPARRRPCQIGPNRTGTASLLPVGYHAKTGSVYVPSPRRPQTNAQPPPRADLSVKRSAKLCPTPSWPNSSQPAAWTAIPPCGPKLLT